MVSQHDVASIGECMVELAPAGNGLYRQGFAGDTLNTAWYIKALSSETCRVRYVSAVGEDALSDQLIAFLNENGIDTTAVARDPTRTIGLYLITLAGAERSFTYWRSDSAARHLASDRGRLAAALTGFGTAYLSGITLAILEEADRQTLFSVLAEFRQGGGAVVFDPNIRPRLWPDRNTLVRVTTEGYRAATIALPTFSDEAELFGDRTPGDTAERMVALGVGEVAVKNGPEPVLVRTVGSADALVPALTEVEPIDTTGAGDSFNGGYIAARLAGHAPTKAARLGHKVAAQVIRHRGALVPFATLANCRLV